MESLLVVAIFAIVGAAAQFVDGSLGMGFGITSATLLSVLGYSAVAASAGTHAAKMGTCLISGTAHWRQGNVDWKVLAAIGVPGGIGAFLGAVVLTNIAMDHAKVWMAAVLFLLGISIIARFGFNRSVLPQISVRTRNLWPVGLVGGFVDATGGGGWGPVATPSMFSLTKHEPYRIVGTVSAAEFIVAVCASAGFLFGAAAEQVPWLAVAGLIAGGLVTAPIAAKFVRVMPRAAMGVFVGFMVLISNGATIMRFAGVPGVAAGLIVLGMVAAALAIGRYAHRREKRAEAVPAQDPESPQGAPAALAGQPQAEAAAPAGQPQAEAAALAGHPEHASQPNPATQPA